MSFDISDVFKSIGPAASIIFAAWIFMGFLQQRYDAAVERYRTMIDNYRTADISSDRRGNMMDQILVYKRRCELMNTASIVGLVSAIFLIMTLIFGELSIILAGISALKYLSAGSAFTGFTLVIAAAVIVLMESVIIQRQIDSELLDVPDLAHGSGQRTGSIADPNRR